MRRVVGEVRAGQRQRQNRVQNRVYCVSDWLIDWLPERSTDCALVCGVCYVCVYDDCVVCDWLIDWLMKLNSNKSQPHSILRQAPVLSCFDCVHWLIDWACVVVVVVGVVGVVLVVVCFVGGLLTFVCMAVVRFDWRHSVCLTDWLIDCLSVILFDWLIVAHLWHTFTFGSQVVYGFGYSLIYFIPFHFVSFHLVSFYSISFHSLFGLSLILSLALSLFFYITVSLLCSFSLSPSSSLFHMWLLLLKRPARARYPRP